MGALTVVLLAEGAGDVGGNALRGPGSPIHEDDWGPAHALMVRVIEHTSGLSRAAIRFVEPLRTRRATLARGSALRKASSLRQLLSYFPDTSRPDLMIVLVDADDEPNVGHELEQGVADMPGTKVIVVAVQEFESWILAAHPQAHSNVESLKRGEAKEQLAQLLAAEVDQRAARRSLAEKVALLELAKRSKSFETCIKKLNAARP